MVWTRFLLLAVLALGACTSAPPRQPDDICRIFDEKRSWYRAAVETEREWGLPIPVGMAFVHRESSYVADAKPPRGRLLWVIPWRRPSSAYGYAQATDEAWSDYRKATSRWMVGRDDFDDALDFIGWYNDRSARKLRLSKQDAYHLYLAYYSGISGFASGRWRSDARVKGYASKVARRAQRYSDQFSTCKKRLSGGFWSWFS